MDKSIEKSRLGIQTHAMPCTCEFVLHVYPVSSDEAVCESSCYQPIMLACVWGEGEGLTETISDWKPQTVVIFLSQTYHLHTYILTWMC